MSTLDRAARDALPAEHFAVPGKRKLPINDPTHTKLAWDMVDRASGLSDDERSEARRRIVRRAKELDIDTSDWHITANFSFEAMSLQVPVVFDHPNRMPFSGVLTRLDQPSDAPPGGAKARTYLPTDVAEVALPSLLGMAVDFKADFEGHDRKQKIGIITGANVVGDAIEIEGFLYAKDFPDECKQIKAEKGALGFSYELDARIRDLDADPWVIDYCVFTGAAILYKDLAAYRTTSLAAEASKEIEMTKEEMQALLAEAIKPLATQIEAQGKKIEGIEAKGASLAGPIIDQVKPHVDAINAAADAMERAGVGNDAKAGHAGVLRKVAAHMCAEAVSGKVPMIYRDHDYLPDARVEAAAAKKADEEKAAMEKKNAELEASVKDLGTKLKDLEAKAFNGEKAPERATLPSNIQTLLAKANIGEKDMKDGKLTTDQVNAVLDAANLHGQKAIEMKLKLRHSGLMDAGRQ